MDWFQLILIILAGFIAGFINTLAGAGSLITLPLLIFIGLPANVANGTNRISVLMQSVVGTVKFKQEKLFRWGETFEYILPSVVGAVVGANLAVTISAKAINLAVGALMVIMFFVILFDAERWMKGSGLFSKSKNFRFVKVLAFFLIGVYGGFIQAGVGYLLLAGFALFSNCSLIKSNALKVLLTLVFTLFALIVFVMNDQVDYIVGVTMGLGSMVGAWLAAHLAIKKGAAFVRYFLLGTIFLFAIKLLFF